MVEGEAVRAVLITGTIGSGKTALAAGMDEALAAKGVAAAIIDLDWLGWFQPASDSETTIDSLIVKNLQAVWPNYRSAGPGNEGRSIRETARDLLRRLEWI